jgi:hypothetical protein
MNKTIYVGRPPEREIGLLDSLVVLVITGLLVLAFSGCGTVSQDPASGTAGDPSDADRTAIGMAPARSDGAAGIGGAASLGIGGTADGSPVAAGGAGGMPWEVPNVTTNPGVCAPQGGAGNISGSACYGGCQAYGLTRLCPAMLGSTLCVAPDACSNSGVTVSGVCAPGGNPCSVYCSVVGYPQSCPDSTGSNTLCCRA